MNTAFAVVVMKTRVNAIGTVCRDNKVFVFVTQENVVTSLTLYAHMPFTSPTV